MWPWLLIVGIGRRRRFPLPFPMFLFWPFVLVGWLIYAIGLPFTRGGWTGLRAVLTLFPGLRGLRVDARPHAGPGVLIRVV
jgi:hypothetical protein